MDMRNRADALIAERGTSHPKSRVAGTAPLFSLRLPLLKCKEPLRVIALIVSGIVIASNVTSRVARAPGEMWPQSALANISPLDSGICCDDAGKLSEEN